MKTLQIILALAVLVTVTVEKNCFADHIDTGFSFDISAGVAVYNTKEKSKPELECEVKPALIGKLTYTFDGGNQIYMGTPSENEGEPTVGATFGNGLIDVSAFYITPVDVYKDPHLAEREETTEVGFGGKITLNEKSFRTSYELRYTEVKDDQIAKRFKELSRNEYTHNLSASYNFDVFGLFFVEPSVDVIYAMNDNDDWSENYSGAKIGISLSKMFGNLIVNVSVKGGENHYANDDPIFNAGRIDRVANMAGAVTWLKPLGFEKYSVTVSGGVETIDSNIDFYDKDATYSIMTIGYHF